MRQFIKEEISGRTSPREIWEDSLQWYGEILSEPLCFPREGMRWPNYRKEFFADQVRFLADQKHWGHWGHKLLDFCQGVALCEFFAEDKDLRRRIAALVAFGEGIFIYEEGQIRSANMLLEALGDDIPEARERLLLAIRKGEELVASSGQRGATEQEREDDLLKQMK